MVTTAALLMDLSVPFALASTKATSATLTKDSYAAEDHALAYLLAAGTRATFLACSAQEDV